MMMKGMRGKKEEERRRNFCLSLSLSLLPRGRKYSDFLASFPPSFVCIRHARASIPHPHTLLYSGRYSNQICAFMQKHLSFALYRTHTSRSSYTVQSFKNRNSAVITVHSSVLLLADNWNYRYLQGGEKYCSYTFTVSTGTSKSMSKKDTRFQDMIHLQKVYQGHFSKHASSSPGQLTFILLCFCHLLPFGMNG